MSTLEASGKVVLSYRPVRFPERRTLVERRGDGTLILRSARALPDIPQRSFADFIPHWAAERGDTHAFCERGEDGAWRSLSWRELWREVRTVAAALLDIGLGPQRPLMLLSGNSVEEAVVLLAAEYAGIPAAPVSPTYALMSRDFARLKAIRERVPPGAVFVQDAGPYAAALAALSLDSAPVIAVKGASAGHVQWRELAEASLSGPRLQRVERAHAAIRDNDTARVLFTSGSTGAPKAVRLTYRNLASVAAYYSDNLFWMRESQPVFLDWLPWHHGLGGVLHLGRAIQFGATHYIDDGRPVPGAIERTMRNLRDVAPTSFTTVPSAWAALATELERDPLLARNLFTHAAFFGYGGASLPVDVYNRIQRVAEQTIGQRMTFCSGLASTETSGMGTHCGWPTDAPGNIGVPVPGAEVKLLPLEGGDGRYEIRMRGPHVFGGYIGQPELTAAAFDDEGFFRLGDAVRLADPDDPSKGMVFAGRTVEDFKLANGSWVRTGALRLALLERCAPLLSDAVICGHDRDYLAALAWPNVAACQRIAPELASLDAQALAKHPLIVAALNERLRNQDMAGATLVVERLILMAEPPSLDANEIADKGYVNQAATRARRAHLIEALYEREPAPHIARARG
ncbi:feruloyl-CoA synthase [Caballeronia ptereochthonis]|uniref:Feruloyl-CoA synthase n=1 Tax=Caballeronia ptereochthonis TaxID=1777144 RepID=A0A157ZE23_9BURK|nr:feruloyl-CoA synthase [Caballeronia ptereochthonis]SAK43822.1 feruloyl-CoA synthase [Caballeronia ptereochthonis]